MFFDIGSNIGKWSLANLSHQSLFKIISIEASPLTFQKLVDNCKDDRIILLNYAVCNNNCNDITFYHADWDTLSTLNKNWLTSETSRFCNTCAYTEIVCKTITIDKLIDQYGIPDLIKIDIEGGEFDCIASLTQKAKLLCFEWASETSIITFNCIDYLYNLGYTEFYIQMEDNYLFRPLDSDFYDNITTKKKLSLTIPKQDWGMIWCR